VVWLLKPGDPDDLVNSRSVKIDVATNHQFTTEEELPKLVVKVFTSKTYQPKCISHADERDDGSPLTSPASECDFIRELIWTLGAEFVRKMLDTSYELDPQSCEQYDPTQLRPFYFHYIMHRHGSGIRCGIIYRHDGNYENF
jgi:hypothetical protein